MSSSVYELSARFARAIAAALALMCALAGAATAQDGYRLNVGDILELDILDDSEPAVRFTVGNDGAVQLPFVGGIVVRDLALDAARDRIRETFVERQIFVDPTVELSIAAYRPVFVLGDVETPGFYDYRLSLSPEQALGLAGGPTVALGDAESRILERRTLEGTLESTDLSLAGTAVAYARTQAQLRGDLEIGADDVPQDIRALLGETDFAAILANENAIMRLEHDSYLTELELIDDMIAEAEVEIDLLAARETAQEASVARAQEDAARGEDLEERGVQTASAMSELYRMADAAADQLLQIRAQQSNAVRRVAELQRDRATLQNSRQQGFLQESQQTFVEMSRIEGERDSILDRLELLNIWSEAWAGADLADRITYRVRRRTGDSTETITVEATDELLPGDLLIVTINAPDRLAELGQ